MSRRIAVAVLATLFTACDRVENPVAPSSPSLSPSTEALGVVGPGFASYSGRASSSATIGIVTKTFCDTGPLPSSGGLRSDHGPNFTIPGKLSTQLFSCRTEGKNRVSAAEADVWHLQLWLPGYTIFADVLSSMARAECKNGNQAFTNGHAHILRLIVNGQQKTVTASKNQKINLNLTGTAYIILNEQTGFNNGTSAALTVTSARVFVPLVANIKLAVSHADIECSEPV